MATQTWAAWLLDSYASSVSPNASENHESNEESEPSSANMAPRSLSSVSPYGPYVRTGRGGAGNYHWQSEQSTQPTDLEAQDTKQSSLSERRLAAARLERIETGDVMKARRTSQYLHLGRGGAGNYGQSNEIQSARSPRAVSSPVISHTPTLGRGGAGNLTLANEAKKNMQLEKEQREREEAERRREQIELDVESALQMPKGAKLSSKRTSMELDVD